MTARQDVSPGDEPQDETDSLYRYIMDTAASVRRGPWYLRPAFMLREQMAENEAQDRGRNEA